MGETPTITPATPPVKADITLSVCFKTAAQPYAESLPLGIPAPQRPDPQDWATVTRFFSRSGRRLTTYLTAVQTDDGRWDVREMVDFTAVHLHSVTEPVWCCARSWKGLPAETVEALLIHRGDVKPAPAPVPA